ncbi:MAG: hypothetical protein E7642_06895 [Ruminococcaceae bacterium]|nr:hypothetical protein [Oscillospiraceae bacterium]
MKIVQRIGGRNFSSDRIEEFIKAVKKHPGSMNAVWLNTKYGYPSLECHKEYAEALAQTAKKLRKEGISVDLQLSNSIGHGEYMSKLDCSALVHEGSPVRMMVGHNGVVANYSFCWNDEYFREYNRELVKYYVSAIRPGEFWIDDDLRAKNHAPVDFGCFCEHCISKFNAKYGYSFDRVSLVDEFLHGDIKVRAQYIEQIRDDIASFTREICEVVKKYSPETVVSLQNCANGPYTGYGHDYIFDTMYDVTGYAPSYRPGGGTYNDHNPNEIIEKCYFLAWQDSMLPDYVKRIYPEIENTPDTAMGKTMAGTAFESTLYLASGMTDLSYAMLGDINEPLEFYEEGFELFSQHNAYWERLAKVSSESKDAGICFAASKKLHLRSLKQSDDMYVFNTEHYRGANMLLRNGLPLTYKDSGTYILHPDAAKQMNREELATLLSCNVLTDAETVEYMQSLGFDLGFKLVRATNAQSLVANEIYTDHPVNKGYHDHFSPSFFTAGRNNKYFMLGIPEGCEVLGYYDKNMICPHACDDPELPFGYTSVIMTTAQGGKWAVMACDLWKGIVPSTQRNRILNIIDCIGDKMPAKIISPIQANLMPRTDADGKTVSASVVNCTIGTEKNIELLIRNPKAERFYFMSQYDGECELTAKKTDDGYLVNIPSLSPWSVGTVFCDK